ncbi:hypothetical protein KJ564_16600 [bacterium]|nr:hypothetical protein [bacterium]
MGFLEIFITLCLFVYVIAITIIYFTSGGRVNELFYWINFILYVALELSKKFVSYQAFAFWYIGLVWVAFLFVRTMFMKIRNPEDFAENYNRKLILFLVSLSAYGALLHAIRSPSAEKITSFVLAIVVLYSFASFLSHSSREKNHFQACLIIQACLLLLLTGFVSSGKLYEIVQTFKGIELKWLLIKDGKFNTTAFNLVSYDLTMEYYANIIAVYLFTVHGAFYHGLIRGAARNRAVLSYAILLIFILVQSVPESRDVLARIPIIGMYVSSPTILLATLAISVVHVLVLSKGNEEDDW